MEKINKVLNFYLLTNTLKDKIRSGVALWNISKDRLESVAEHIYGTCMLAIALDSEYDFNIDIYKSIMMLTIHELEECVIGDLTPFDKITPEEKITIGEKAVSDILEELIKKNEYLSLTKEFNEQKTNEAIFANHCDKLEMLIQMKIYEESEYSDINHKDNEKLLKVDWVRDLINNGSNNIADIFIDHQLNTFLKDKVFIEFANYLKKNQILKKISTNQ